MFKAGPESTDSESVTDAIGGRPRLNWNSVTRRRRRSRHDRPIRATGAASSSTWAVPSPDSAGSGRAPMLRPGASRQPAVAPPAPPAPTSPARAHARPARRRGIRCRTAMAAPVREPERAVEQVVEQVVDPLRATRRHSNSPRTRRADRRANQSSRPPSRTVAPVPVPVARAHVEHVRHGPPVRVRRRRDPRPAFRWCRSARTTPVPATPDPARHAGRPGHARCRRSGDRRAGHRPRRAALPLAAHAAATQARLHSPVHADRSSRRPRRPTSAPCGRPRSDGQPPAAARQDVRAHVAGADRPRRPGRRRPRCSGGTYLYPTAWDPALTPVVDEHPDRARGAEFDHTVGLVKQPAAEYALTIGRLVVDDAWLDAACPSGVPSDSPAASPPSTASRPRDRGRTGWRSTTRDADRIYMSSDAAPEAAAADLRVAVEQAFAAQQGEQLPATDTRGHRDSSACRRAMRSRRPRSTRYLAQREVAVAAQADDAAAPAAGRPSRDRAAAADRVRARGDRPSR